MTTAAEYESIAEQYQAKAVEVGVTHPEYANLMEHAIGYRILACRARKKEESE